MPQEKWYDPRLVWGFTIAELIIYLTILGILGIFGARILDLALKGKTSISRSNEVQLVSSRTMAQIIDRVHSSLTITDASSTLNLQMVSSSQNPTIVSLSSGTIIMQEGSATSSLTSATVYVSALTFTKITNPSPSTSSVQIQMTTGYNDNGTADPNTLYSLQTTVMPL